jgi:hypothetical protein
MRRDIRIDRCIKILSYQRWITEADGKGKGFGKPVVLDVDLVHRPHEYDVVWRNEQRDASELKKIKIKIKIRSAGAFPNVSNDIRDHIRAYTSVRVVVQELHYAIDHLQLHQKIDRIWLCIVAQEEPGALHRQ